MSTCGDLNHGTYSAAPTEQSQASLDTGGPFMSLPSAFSMASTSSSSLEDEAYSALSPRAAAPGSVAQDGPPVFSAEHLGDYELINARLRPPSDRNETPSSS